MSATTGSPFPFRGLVGTGGIGCGSFFELRGNHTLGREESRGGRFLDRRDYCKLHIIAHYVQRLTGPSFVVLPVGKVGDDEHGRSLLEEMRADGLDTRRVQIAAGKSTLFSFCFVYPDGSGGNMTVDDSASAAVSPDDIRETEPDIAALGRQGIVLAAPEAPLAARAALIDLGTRYGGLRAASFTSGEIKWAMDSGILNHIDVLAVNADEAATLAGVDRDRPPESIVEALAERLRGVNPSMAFSMTAGARGSWVGWGADLHHLPVFRVVVASTAGAGDAHFAGLLSGLAAGLSMAESHELAALAAAVKVTSPHTINKALTRASLAQLARESGSTWAENVRRFLAS